MTMKEAGVWAPQNAIELLHRAIDHPDCDLDRPPEAISKDPNLRSLSFSDWRRTASFRLRALMCRIGPSCPHSVWRIQTFGSQ